MKRMIGILIILILVSSAIFIGLAFNVGYHDEPVSSKVSCNPVFSRASARAFPDAPVNLNAEPGDGNVYLSWSPPPSDGGSEIINYIVYRGEDPGMVEYYDETGVTTSYSDDSVSNGVTYYYQVSAENDDGIGSRSNEVSATPAGSTPQYYTFSGTVYDEDTSDCVDGAFVEIVNENTEEVYNTYTDGSGYFSLNIPEGSYEFFIRAHGYEEYYETIYISGSIENEDYYVMSSGGSGEEPEGGDVFDAYDDGIGDEYDGGDNGDGGDNNDGDNGDGENEGDEFASEMEGTLQNVIFFSLIILAILFFCLITITVASVATFMRLGKIKRSLKDLQENSKNQPPPQPQGPPPAAYYHSPAPPPPPPPPPRR